MSDLVLIAALSSFPPAIMGCVSAFFSYRAAVHAKAALIQSERTEENTNHMKDELVAAVKLASHAEGRAEGIAYTQEEKPPA